MIRITRASAIAVFIGIVLFQLAYYRSSAGGYKPKEKAPARFGTVTVNQSLIHDVSRPFRALAQTNDESEVPPSQRPSPTPTPPVMTSPPGAEAIEQTSQGNRASADVVANFDGLGAGFKGPQGTAVLRNPSDNSLAVGTNHIFQIVNTRMAIYSKKGKQFDRT